MRLLFSTQSESLRLFERLSASLAKRTSIERCGFVVADSLAYMRWLRERPDFEAAGHALLKEWEITAHVNDDVDISELAQYEKSLGGQAGLFGAIVADRRLFMGKDCTYSQDYTRRFTDRQLLSVLQRGLREMERLFDELKPDVVIGFICVTMLDYLAYLFARSRGIRFLNLRPTRVGDRVAFTSTLNDPAPEFMAAYERIVLTGESPYLAQARSYVSRVREQHGRYEGVIRPSERPALKVNRRGGTALAVATRVMAGLLDYRRTGASNDNHVPNPLRALIFASLINPLRARVAAGVLKHQYFDPARLSATRYAFFPLHTEPEVSLLVYGRPFLNQFELVRMIALSLPVDMVLVVKEHPWMVGKRPIRAYRELLNIPRVRIAHPATEARALIGRAALVTVITGSVALEAAILGKPVLTFGDCPYNALPASMVRRCADLRSLQLTIADLITSYQSVPKHLEAYVAATLETSASTNLYSVLLGKAGVHAERTSAYDSEIQSLADYLLRILDEPVRQGARRSLDAAVW